MNLQHTFGALVICCAACLLAQPGRAADPAQPVKPLIRNFANQTPLPGMKAAPAGKAAAPAARLPSPATTGRANSAMSNFGGYRRKATTGTRAGRPGAVAAKTHASRTVGNDDGPPPRVRSRGHHAITLDAGITRSVPKTPEEVSAYLITMKGVISQYQDLISTTLLSGGSGQKLSPESLSAARQQAVEMIQTIRSVSPPRELSAAHNQLDTTWSDVSTFIQNPGGTSGGGLKALAQMGPLLGQFLSTMERYHSGVKNCIAYYQLDPSLDPFSGENQDTKAQVTSLYDSLKGGLIKAPAAAGAQGSQPDDGAGGAPGGLDLGALSGLLGGLGGAGTTGASGGDGGLDMSKLGNMKDMNGIDFGALLGGGGGGVVDAGALGGLLTGGGGGDAGALGSMLGGGGGNGSAAQMPNLSDPDTQNSINNVFKLLQAY